MPKRLTLILFCLLPLSGFSQNKLLDSLKGQFQLNRVDTARFDTYSVYIKASRFDYPDSAIKVSEVALALAEKIQDNLRMAQGQNLLGTGYYFKGDFATAESWQRKAIATCQQYNLDKELPNALSSLALALQSQSKFTEAIEAYFESIKQEEANDNPRGLARSLGNLAILYRNLSDYDNAIQYAKRALSIISTRVPDWEVALAGSYNTVGLSFLDESKYDSAIIYLQKSYKINRKLNNITYQANSASNITFCYLEQHQTDSAARYIELAIPFLPKISNQSIAGTILINLGSVRLAQNKIADAIQYSHQGLAMLKKTNSKKGMLDAYTTLAEVYSKLGNHKLAFEYLNSAYQLNDSLKIEQAQDKAANVERDYEIQKKQQSIDLMAREAKLSDAKLNNERQVRGYLIASIALLVVTVGSVYYGFRQKIKSNKGLQAKNDEIATKNALLERVNRNLQDQALRSQMKPHFIFNALNSIQFLIIQKENDKAYDYLSKFSQLLRSALEFSDQDLIELEKELKWLELYVQLESLRFNHGFEFKLENTLPTESMANIKMPPFLIQPFLENAIAHGLMTKSSDRMLQLQLTNENRQLIISVSDNGIGREAAAKLKATSGKKHRSFGVDLVNKRLEILKTITGKNFTCVVQDRINASGEPEGTVVKLQIPI